MTGYIVQNISLRRDRFTKGEAYHWVRKNGYKPIKEVHMTPHFYQFRLVDPERLHGGRYRTIALGDAGHMIVWYAGPEK